jgi:tetratricopeptide (TPR) repeat protein
LLLDTRQLPNRSWAICLLIAAAAFVVYIPAIDHGFVRSWDDGVFIASNLDLYAPDAMQRIWTTLEMPRGYPNYPLVFTSYRLEYLLWGSNPGVHHTVNILLHALNAVLVFLVLRSLSASRRLSSLAALLFALHPMQVESVAWITERKNVLFAAFFLAAFLAYRRFRNKSSWVAYVACLGLFVCALLSKTTSITLVASLFLADWIVDGRRRLRDTLPLAPMAALGAAAAYMTTLVEYAETSPPVAMAFRPFLVARATWFYLGKLLWPHPLLPVYKRWPGLRPYDPEVAEFLSVGFIVALVALVATGIAVWLTRRRIPTLAMWGLGHFFVTLLPILGVVHFAYQTHTFVADRYVYVAAVGLFLAIGAILAPALTKVATSVPTRSALVLALTALMAVLGAMTWRQAGIWKNATTLWGHTLRYNDGSHEAHNSIGVALLGEGKTDEAIAHLERALQIKPYNFKTLNNLANAFNSKKQYERAIPLYRRALALRPDYAKAHYNLGVTYWKLERLEAAEHHLRKAIEYDGNYVKAYDRLAWLLATWPDAKVRNGPEALILARRACELGQYKRARHIVTLAAAQAEAGHFEQAIQTAERALALVPKQNGPAAEYIRAIIQSFQARQPLASRRY